VLASVLAASGACTLLVDLDDLNERPASPAGASAGPGGGGATASGGGVAGAGTPGSGGHAGGEESGGGGAGGSKPLCVPPQFCDDFDSGAIGSKWSGATSLSAELTLDTATYVSPPNGFRATLDAANPAQERTGYLNHKFAAAKKITCEFDFYQAVKTDGEDVRFVQILPDLTPPLTSYNFNLWMRGDGTGQIEEWACFDSTCTDSFIHQAPFTGYAFQKWIHLVLELTYGGSAVLTIDGGLAASLALYDQAPPAETFFLGAQSTGVGPFSFVFDNVVCDSSL